MVTSTALFCSRNSGAEANQRSLYQGPQFVYTFHADAVTPLLALGQRLSGLLRPAQLTSPIHSSTGGLKTFASVLAPEKTFASVAGSMSSLNVLLELPPMDTGTFRLSTHPAQLQGSKLANHTPLTLAQLSSLTSIRGCLSMPRCSLPSSASHVPEPIL